MRIIFHMGFCVLLGIQKSQIRPLTIRYPSRIQYFTSVQVLVAQPEIPSNDSWCVFLSAGSVRALKGAVRIRTRPGTIHQKGRPQNFWGFLIPLSPNLPNLSYWAFGSTRHPPQCRPPLWMEWLPRRTSLRWVRRSSCGHSRRWCCRRRRRRRSTSSPRWSSSSSTSARTTSYRCVVHILLSIFQVMLQKL